MFISATFVGMMLGSFATGFLGDRYGRRFTYQFNLLVFGLASLAAAFAPNMTILIACRFVMGFGLGAENVVGYSTMTEFVPASTARQMARADGGLRRDGPAGVAAGRVTGGSRSSAGGRCSCSAASAR